MDGSPNARTLLWAGYEMIFHVNVEEFILQTATAIWPYKSRIIKLAGHIAQVKQTSCLKVLIRQLDRKGH